MIGLLENKLLTVKNKKILELGAGYVENIHFEIAKKNDLTISDIVPIHDDIDNQQAQLKIITADACHTNLEHDSFDIVVSSMLIQHIDIQTHFHEVRRILKKDGVYWFACTGHQHNKELHHSEGPLLNVDAHDFSNYGAVEIAEELYTMPYSFEELVQYARLIKMPMLEKIPKGTFLSVTKHYYLFEMRN